VLDGGVDRSMELVSVLENISWCGFRYRFTQRTCLWNWFYGC